MGRTREVVSLLVLLLSSCCSQWVVVEQEITPDQIDPWSDWQNAQSDGILLVDSFQSEEPENEDLPRATTTETTVERLAEKVDELLSQLKSQQEKIAELEQSNKNLVDKIDVIEQQVKTNNLIFYNVSESARENYKSTLQKVLYIMNRLMKVRVNSGDISVALRADTENNSTNRIIVVKFTNFATRMKVLAAQAKLRRTNLRVTADYSEQVSKIREQLLPFLYEARRRGQNAFLLYNMLVVDGVKMSLADLQKEEEEMEDDPPVEDDQPVEDDPPVEDDSELNLLLSEPQQESEDPDDQVEEVYVPPEFQDQEYDE